MKRSTEDSVCKYYSPSGDGNFIIVESCQDTIYSLQILFPVRGRKPRYFLYCPIIKLFANTIPRQGTETMRMIFVKIIILFANTIPRQGTKPLYYILFLFKETKNEFCIFYFLSSYKRAILKD